VRVMALSEEVSIMSRAGLGQPFHFGLVVEDVPSAMDELGSALGLDWTAIQTMSNTQWSRQHGLVKRTRSVVFSIQEPHIELLNSAPDSVWERTGLHHIGYWADDIEASAARLEGLGFIRETSSYALTDGSELIEGQDTSKVIGTYHRHASSNLLVELCDLSIRERIEGFFASA
jgi:catechol 2,3-dioxygenase-like lactoylglutathione lyase family enzyme